MRDVVNYIFLFQFFRMNYYHPHRKFAESFCKKDHYKTKKSQKLASEKWLERVRQPGKEGKYLTPPTFKE